MPIGKNSLKRVTNNGYSAVKTSAPDMENSVIVTPIESPVAAPAEAKAAPVDTSAPATAQTATPAPVEAPVAAPATEAKSDPVSENKPKRGRKPGSKNKKTTPAEAKPAAKGKKTAKTTAKPDPVSQNGEIDGVKKPTTAKKPAKKTTAAKKAASAPASGDAPRRRGRPPKSASAIPTAPETAPKITEKVAEEKSFYRIGDEMPIYLL